MRPRELVPHLQEALVLSFGMISEIKYPRVPKMHENQIIIGGSSLRIMKLVKNNR
jgi:hypothetical protein